MDTRCLVCAAPQELSPEYLSYCSQNSAEFLAHIGKSEHLSKLKQFLKGKSNNKLHIKQSRGRTSCCKEIKLLSTCLPLGITPLFFNKDPISSTKATNVIVMERIVGENFSKHHVRDSVVLSKVAHAINQLHQKIFHNDLKEEHIVIQKEGLVRILDLDLASDSKEASENARANKKLKSDLLASPNISHLGFFRGTRRYASVDVHMGCAPRVNSEFESLFYICMYLLFEKMPWSQIEDIFEIALIKVRFVLKYSILRLLIIEKNAANVPGIFIAAVDALTKTNTQFGEANEEKKSSGKSVKRVSAEPVGYEGYEEDMYQAAELATKSIQVASTGVKSIDKFSETNLQQRETQLSAARQQAGDRGELVVLDLLGRIVRKTLTGRSVAEWPQILPTHLVFPFNSQGCQTDLYDTSLSLRDLETISSAPGILAFPLADVSDEDCSGLPEGNAVLGEIATKLPLGDVSLDRILLRKRQQIAGDNMRIVEDGHPLEIVEKVRYSLLIIAVDNLQRADVEQLKDKARRLLKRDILRYPVDTVLAAVKRYWIMYVTSAEVGELIGKVLEMESLLLGGPSVVTQMASLGVAKEQVFCSLWHKGKEIDQRVFYIPPTCTTISAVKDELALAFHNEKDVRSWQISFDGKVLGGFARIPPTNEADFLTVVVPDTVVL